MVSRGLFGRRRLSARILITENAQTLELIVGYVLWRSATLFGSDGNSLAGRRQRVDLEGSN